MRKFIQDVISSTRKNYIPELIISILSSGVPMLYFFNKSGEVSRLEGHVENSLASDEIVYYMALSAVAFAGVAIIRHFFRTEAMKSIYMIVHGISSGLINVYRLAAGILLVFPVIWYLAEPGTLTIDGALFLLLFGLGCVFVSSLFLSIHDRIESAFDARA